MKLNSKARFYDFGRLGLVVLVLLVGLDAHAQQTSLIAEIGVYDRVQAKQSFKIGLQHADAGRYAEAEQQFLNSIRSAPDIASPYFNLAELLRSNQDCSKAAFFYQQFLMRNQEAELVKAAQTGLESCSKARVEAVVAYGTVLVVFPVESNQSLVRFYMGEQFVTTFSHKKWVLPLGPATLRLQRGGCSTTPKTVQVGVELVRVEFLKFKCASPALWPKYAMGTGLVLGVVGAFLSYKTIDARVSQPDGVRRDQAEKKFTDFRTAAFITWAPALMLGGMGAYFSYSPPAATLYPYQEVSQ